MWPVSEIRSHNKKERTRFVFPLGSHKSNDILYVVIEYASVVVALPFLGYDSPEAGRNRFVPKCTRGLSLNACVEYEKAE